MWIVYALLASALWGLEYALMGRLFNGRITPMSLITIQMAIGTLLVGTLAVSSGSFQKDISFIKADPSLLRLILVSAIVFALGSLMIATSVKEGNAVIAGLVEISYPLFIILFLTLFGWNEPLGVRVFLGGALIMLGAVMVHSAT
jgi:drug/metabolite transporter (DMT)-like permease